MHLMTSLILIWNQVYIQMKFCQKLLVEKGVAVVPGLGFGSEGYFRLSFATDDATIKDGIARIASFVENYSK